MAITVYCGKCGGSLEKPGGLLFYPPEGIFTKKLHICVKCFGEFEFLISEG